MQKNINKEDANSTILNLEVLKKEYDSTLIKYNQAQSDYASSLLEKDNRTYKSFTDIKGKTFLGTELLSEDFVTTSLDDCKEACASNSKCTGATYNLDKTYCSLRSGESGASDGSENDYAIMSKKQVQLKAMSALSDRLLDINSQILRIVKQSRPELVDLQKEKQIQISSLSQNYSDLTTQRESLNKIIRETQKLGRVENQSEILITKNYSTYILFMVVTIAVGVGIIKFSSVGKGQSSSEEPKVAPAPAQVPETKEEFAEEEEEEETQQVGGRRHSIKPKYRVAILIVVSVFMIILTSRLATACCAYVVK